MPKTHYNLFYKGLFVARTTDIKTAKNLEVLGWAYQTIKIYLG